MCEGGSWAGLDFELCVLEGRFWWSAGGSVVGVGVVGVFMRCMHL